MQMTSKMNQKNMSEVIDILLGKPLLFLFENFESLDECFQNSSFTVEQKGQIYYQIL